MKKRRSNIPLVWLKGFTDRKEAEDFEEILRNNTRLFTAFRNIIHSLEEELQQRESTPSDYNSGSWSHKQAFRNGQRSIMRKMLQLTDFIEG